MQQATSTTPSRARFYCFTVNNPQDGSDNADDGDFEKIDRYLGSEHCRYGIYQLEEGEGGTPHMQGYFELFKATTISAIKRHCGIGRMHLEVRRGSRDQARDYCRKEDSRIREPLEFGEWVYCNKCNDVVIKVYQ